VLDDTARARILDFVRPLSVGLDGSTNYGYVERRLSVSRRLAERQRALRPDQTVDEGQLFLLAAFAGLPDRRVAAGSRSELLLQGAGVSRQEIAALFRSLRRFEAEPQTPEERLVRDAGLLESVGAYGVAQLVVQGARERQTLLEMAEEIVGRVSAVRFATEAGEEAGAEGVAFARDFAARLAEEVRRFED
jgi:hypothetical protein